MLVKLTILLFTLSSLESFGGEDGEFDYPASLVQGISDILEHGEGCYDHCTGMLPDEYYWKSYCMVSVNLKPTEVPVQAAALF